MRRRRTPFLVFLIASGCATAPSLPAQAPPVAPTEPVIAAANPPASPAPAGEYAVEASLERGSGGLHAFLQVAVPCSRGRCDRAPLDLGTAQAMRSVGLVDLLGPSVTLFGRRPASQAPGLPKSRPRLPTVLPASAGLPAAVVIVGDWGGGDPPRSGSSSCRCATTHLGHLHLHRGRPHAEQRG